MITKGQSDFIKLVAIFAMVLDHVGHYLYPGLIELIVFGRIAFPIFAYQLTISYAMTSSKKDYLMRLLAFGLISQVPYYFLIEDFRLNILFTLALGVLALWALENKKYYYYFLIIPAFLFVEYSLYALSIILIFYLFKNKIAQFVLFITATFLYSLYLLNPIQILAILSLPFIIKPFLLEIRLPRNFFYIFFPAHLLIILLIKNMFFNS